jgi:methylglutaconyl-CoA hydratase
MLTGDTFDGVRAAEVGLATAAVPPEELDAAVARYTQSLVRGAPAALAATKQLTRRGSISDQMRSIRDQLAELTQTSVRFFTSDEGREGVAAFANKRDPWWVPPSDFRDGARPVQ